MDREDLVLVHRTGPHQQPQAGSEWGGEGALGPREKKGLWGQQLQVQILQRLSSNCYANGDLQGSSC